MRVIGTAGHVDHGKSTLVRALTGIDPDRLKEEKAREMTIDLGFAHFTLPDGQVVSLIDVPGHRDFIENMLAGVGGIDAAILVIAADEGMMPQTREHLAILDLLRIPAGVVALTKTDLADDPEWLALVHADIRTALAGTMLDSAPIVPLSARRGSGLDDLRSALSTVLQKTPARIDRGSPRMWIDRVFTISGFGTVVTGTLLDGALTVGQEVECQPSRLRARIRGIQAHGEAQTVASAGSRAAINLAGVERQQVKRGQLLTLPDTLQATLLIDVQFDHLRTAGRVLRHNNEVKFFCGSAECMARVRLIGAETLAAGESGWLQLELAAPLPLRNGDRFILRYPSPGETFGGGTVIDAHPGQRWRRLRPDVVTRFETLARGDPADIVSAALAIANQPLTIAQLADSSALGTNLIATALATLPDIITVPDGFFMHSTVWESAVQKLNRVLQTFHKDEPLRSGMSADALHSRSGMDQAAFRSFIALCNARGVLRSMPNGEIALPDHKIRFTVAQQSSIQHLLRDFARAPYSPPSYTDASAIVGEAVLRALIDRGDLIQVSPEVLFTAEAFGALCEAIHDTLLKHGRVDVKTLRDQVGTSRKYALAILEHLDKIGFTRRDGDDRVLNLWPPRL